MLQTICKADLLLAASNGWYVGQKAALWMPPWTNSNATGQSSKLFFFFLLYIAQGYHGLLMFASCCCARIYLWRISGEVRNVLKKCKRMSSLVCVHPEQSSPVHKNENDTAKRLALNCTPLWMKWGMFCIGSVVAWCTCSRTLLKEPYGTAMHRHLY